MFEGPFSWPLEFDSVFWDSGPPRMPESDSARTRGEIGAGPVVRDVWPNPKFWFGGILQQFVKHSEMLSLFRIACETTAAFTNCGRAPTIEKTSIVIQSCPLVGQL